MMLGYIPIFISAARISLPHPVRYSLHAVLNKGQEVRYGVPDRIILGLLNVLIGAGVLVLIFRRGIWHSWRSGIEGWKYQSWKCTLLGNGVFSLWIMGYVSRMFLTRVEFFTFLESNYGAEYTATLASYTPNWMFPVLFVVTFIGGILGALLGKAVLKKHFEKAGIA